MDPTELEYRIRWAEREIRGERLQECHQVYSILSALDDARKKYQYYSPVWITLSVDDICKD